MVQQIPAIAHPLAVWLRCLAMEAKLYLHLARTLVVLAGLILVVSMYSVWSQTSFFDKLLIFVIFALMWVMMFMIRAFHKVLGVQYSWETWLREQWNSRRRLRMIMHPTFHAHPELTYVWAYENLRREIRTYVLAYVRIPCSIYVHTNYYVRT